MLPPFLAILQTEYVYKSLYTFLSYPRKRRTHVLCCILAWPMASWPVLVSSNYSARHTTDHGTASIEYSIFLLQLRLLDRWIHGSSPGAFMIFWWLTELATCFWRGAQKAEAAASDSLMTDVPRSMRPASSTVQRTGQRGATCCCFRTQKKQPLRASRQLVSTPIWLRAQTKSKRENK